MAHEYGQAATDDSDTSSGSWAAGEKGNVGSTTSGMSLCCQTKIVTAAGTQTFNPTWANSSDNSEGWIQIAEALTSTPGVVALTTTKYAPTVSAPRLCTPPTLALTATRYAPTVSAPRLVTVGAGPAMVVVNAGGGGAPGLYAIIGWRPTPTTKVLTLTTFAPTVTALNPQTATPVTASLTLSPFAPTAQVPRLCTPVAVANALATFAPGVFAPRLCTPTTLAAGLATFAPVVRLPKLATPTTAALAITAYAPTVEVAATNQTATPITASLTLAAFAPSVSLPRTATPATRGVAVTLYTPSVVVATNLVVVVGAASMATSSYAPRVRWEPLAFRLEVGDDVSCSNCEVGSSVTVRQEVTP
jgi:hypothetical protein